MHLGIVIMAADLESIHSRNLFVSFANRFSMLNVFECYHGHIDYSVFNFSVATEMKKARTNKTDTFEIQASLTMADLMSNFKIKNLCSLILEKTY